MVRILHHIFKIAITISILIYLVSSNNETRSFQEVTPICIPPCTNQATCNAENVCECKNTNQGNGCTEEAVGEWATWQECTRTCNCGLQSREFDCSVAANCRGGIEESRVCNPDPCTVTPADSSAACVVDLSLTFTALTTPTQASERYCDLMSQPHRQILLDLINDNYCQTNGASCCEEDANVPNSQAPVQQVLVRCDSDWPAACNENIVSLLIEAVLTEECTSNSKKRRKRQAESNGAFMSAAELQKALSYVQADSVNMLAASVQFLTGENIGIAASAPVVASSVYPVEITNSTGSGSGSGSGTGGGSRPTDSDDDDDLPWWAILLIVLAILFLLLILVIIFILVKMKSSAVHTSQEDLQGGGDTDSINSGDQLVSGGQSSGAAAAAGRATSSRSRRSARQDGERPQSRVAWTEGQQTNGTQESDDNETARPIASAKGRNVPPPEEKVTEEPRCMSPPGTSDYEERQALDDEERTRRSQTPLKQDVELEDDSPVKAKPGKSSKSGFPNPPGDVDKDQTWKGVSKKRRQELEFV